MRNLDSMQYKIYTKQVGIKEQQWDNNNKSGGGGRGGQKQCHNFHFPFLGILFILPGRQNNMSELTNTD